MTGGYSAVARELAARHPDRKITRQQVYLWNMRGTLNAAGQRFPSPIREEPMAKSRQPRLIFDSAAIERWLEPGIPMGSPRAGMFLAS